MYEINEYGKYTPRELREALFLIKAGDSEQLHNALLVVCDLLTTLEARLERLEGEKRVGSIA